VTTNLVETIKFVNKYIDNVDILKK